MLLGRRTLVACVLHHILRQGRAGAAPPCAPLAPASPPPPTTPKTPACARIHTGYEWNKYNQTHYDHDNPPPKVVQGYKFNIFYPDLIDKKTVRRAAGKTRGQGAERGRQPATAALHPAPSAPNPAPPPTPNPSSHLLRTCLPTAQVPSYRIEADPSGSRDTCILVFTAGAPYEDIAFRVVNKEWCGGGGVWASRAAARACVRACVSVRSCVSTAHARLLSAFGPRPHHPPNHPQGDDAPPRLQVPVRPRHPAPVLQLQARALPALSARASRRRHAAVHVCGACVLLPV